MVRLLSSVLLFLSFSALSRATDIIYNSRSATSLNKVTLYPDSSFAQHSNIVFGEGVLFEVLGQSREEHEDNTQNQKFKWFRVRTMDGQEGWIYGDGLAVILDDQAVSAALKKYHKRKVQFNNGFENSVMWVASIEGRDNLHKQDYLNPLYNEFYLVITNDREQSVHINFAGASAMGVLELKQMQLQDVTGDDVPELLIQQSSFPIGSDLEYRKFELYSMQAGTLGKIFSESMTLHYEEDLPSPALFKFLEIEEKIIRVEYIDYLFCKDYTLDYKTDQISPGRERCMEYVTYTYRWDERMKMYQLLYSESRSAPQAGIKVASIYLRNIPDQNAPKAALIRNTDRLNLIKHHEKIVVENGQKKIENYFLVRTDSGKLGYLPAELVGFVDTAHAKLLDQYYRLTPLSKILWKSEDSFLKLSPPIDGSVSIK